MYKRQELHSGQGLGILIEAEAIQAENFLPDFSGMSPWGNQKILACVHEKGRAPSCPAPGTKLSVEFSGKAHKLLAVPGDFFNNLGIAMPGDRFKDTVEVSNTTDQEAEIFFRTKVNSKNKENIELLQQIRDVYKRQGFWLKSLEIHTLFTIPGWSWTSGFFPIVWKQSAG